MMKSYFVLVLMLIASLVSAQKQVYSIGILLDKQTEEIKLIAEELRQQISTVVGEDASIVFDDQNVLINEFNLEQARAQYAQLLENNTDIILAFGAVNSVVISEQSNYLKPTILFGTVNKDLIPLDPNQTSSSTDNFTYLIESQSFQNDIGKLKELTDFKKLGIIIERQIIDILPVKAIFDRELAAVGADYQLIPFNDTDDIISNLEGLDAIYLAGGFLLSSEDITQLANVFIEKKLPAFTSTGIEDVQNGLFATNQGADNSEQIQRRIALTIEAYINGAKLSELPVLIETEPRLTINYNTAESVDVPIKYSLIATTDFIGGLENTISEKEYDLLAAIRQMMNANLTLFANQKDIELASQDIAIAKSDYLPSIEAALDGSYVDPDLADASFGQNPEFSTSGSITAKQLIFSQSVSTNIAIQEELLKVEQQNFNANQLDLIFDVSSIYLGTLVAKANAQIQLRNLGLTKKNLQISEQNFEVGESGKSDILRFRSEIAQNTQSMVEAINQLEQNFVYLNQILNNPVDMEIDVEDIQLDERVFDQYNYNELVSYLDDARLREPFIDFLVSEAIKNAPELKALDHNLEVTRLSVDLYRRGRYYPTVAAQGQYNRTFNRNGAGSETSLPDGNYSLGLNISLPIFNQNLNNLNEQTANIQKDQLNINKDNTKLAIAVNIRTNILDLINQISNIELSKISEATAEESLDLTQTAYSSGSVNIIQLIDAQNNLLDAQLARASAVYNFLTSALQLERSLGYFFLLNSESDNLEFRQRFLNFIAETKDQKK